MHVFSSVGAKINDKDTATPQVPYDLWVVGAGHLGGLVAQEWKRRYPTSSVVAETYTTARHDILRRAGAIPRLRRDRSERDQHTAANVVVCFPPSAATEGKFLDEIDVACNLWAGRLVNPGILLYTSSTVVYGSDAESNEVFDEKSELKLDSPRALRLDIEGFNEGK